LKIPKYPIVSPFDIKILSFNGSSLAIWGCLSQFSLNVQFKSNIQVPFSAQKLSNCLATVDEAAQKAL